MVHMGFFSKNLDSCCLQLKIIPYYRAGEKGEIIKDWHTPWLMIFYKAHATECLFKCCLACKDVECHLFFGSFLLKIFLE